jgi:hypothetical protein
MYCFGSQMAVWRPKSGLENIHTAIRHAPREWEPPGYEDI